MLKEYFKLQFSVREQKFEGFCLKIQDDFHETYAVVLDGYRSFCVWMDDKTATWNISKNTSVDKEAIDVILNEIALG
jgi:hypothetical protein